MEWKLKRRTAFLVSSAAAQCHLPPASGLPLWLSSGLTPRADGRNVNGRPRKKRWAVGEEWAPCWLSDKGKHTPSWHVREAAQVLAGTYPPLSYVTAYRFC